MLDQEHTSVAELSANKAWRFIFFSSCFLISLEDLTMNQSYSFAEMHGTFIQFDRSVQIFQKDKRHKIAGFLLSNTQRIP